MARELQRALYRAAKASPTRRFHALYDKMYREDVLAKAWREVKANAGSAGVDGQTIEQIEQQEAVKNQPTGVSGRGAAASSSAAVRWRMGASMGIYPSCWRRGRVSRTVFPMAD